MTVRLFWGAENISPTNEHKYKASVTIGIKSLQRNSDMLADRMLVNIVVILKISAPIAGTDPECVVPSPWKCRR
jgi:hypothetical protein